MPRVAETCSDGAGEGYFPVRARVGEQVWLDEEMFFVMKVSPDAVAIPERKGWKNRHSACGIATQLLPSPFNFLERRAPRARKHLRSMEQCFEAKAGKRRLLAHTLFHDCSMIHARELCCCCRENVAGNFFLIKREE